MKGKILDGAALRMTLDDNVATALEDLPNRRTFLVSERTVTLNGDIPFGHKFAVEVIDRSEEVYKYGEVIGRATQDISPGEWVHTHNCESTRGRGDLGPETEECQS